MRGKIISKELPYQIHLRKECQRTELFNGCQLSYDMKPATKNGYIEPQDVDNPKKDEAKSETGDFT
eukprot:3960329-Amphidinium_carterae.1